jgi:hypothetical protein
VPASSGCDSMEVLLRLAFICPSWSKPRYLRNSSRLKIPQRVGSCFSQPILVGGIVLSADAPPLHGAIPAILVVQSASATSACLTSRRKLHTRIGGTPLPNEGHLSGRVDADDLSRSAADAAAKSFLLVRPLRQTPRLVSRHSTRRDARPFAPLG